MAVQMPDVFLDSLGVVHKSTRAKLEEIPRAIDLVVTTEGTASRFLGSINSIYHRILAQGLVVYEHRTAYPGANISHQSR